ncbi:GNAT family N-acetyltransferase [Paenibacillus sp. GCM10023252]|uniref:GNAT family N-acetyltransferase n=1 Tax=Paenibacillus sp. GCM10023252 TaxID=3252649 RepID=UPI003610D1D6
MREERIQIRPSARIDSAQLMQLDNELWNPLTAPVPIHFDSEQQFEDSNPPGSLLVAVMGNTVCGYIGYRASTPLPSNSHVAELNIGVHSSHHRKGIGRMLIEALEEKLASEGRTKLALRVLATNEQAISFYESCGFAEQGRLVGEFYLDGRYVDDVLMYKWLI